jgi:prepilin-type N-terminal cleavage/methylation domain-containing protein
MSQRGKSESGMTLIEVIASIALLGLVAVGIMTLLVASIRQNKLAEMRSIATGLASQRIQQLVAHPYMTSANYLEYKLPEETAVTGSPTSTLTTNYGLVPLHPEFMRVVTLTYNSPVTGMLRVQTDVSWVDRRQGTKTHTIVTYLHPKLEEGA